MESIPERRRRSGRQDCNLPVHGIVSQSSNKGRFWDNPEVVASEKTLKTRESRLFGGVLVGG
jgi:hypothetical protein